MQGYQIAGLAVSLLGVIGLGYTPGEAGENYVLGFVCAAVCVLGWSLEAVICAYGMRDPEVTNEHALMIRQGTSAVFYGVVLLPLLNGWKFAVSAAVSTPMLVILAAAFFGTASYLCYYKAIPSAGSVQGNAAGYHLFRVGAYLWSGFSPYDSGLEECCFWCH